MDTLRFSRKSWHFWLYSRSVFFLPASYRKGAKNLCRYFWSIVGITVGNLLLIGAIVSLLLFLVMVIVTHLRDILIVAAIVASMATLFGATWFLCDQFDKWRGSQKKAEKQPNLLSEYLKAKKAKYCPMIEWRD